MQKLSAYLFIAFFLLICAFAGAETQSFDLILSIDESGSMKRTDPTGARRNAAEVFLMLCGQNHRVGLVGFGTDARLAAPPHAMGPGLERDETLALVRGIQSSSRYTDIEQAIRRARDELLRMGTEKRHRVILLLTDGKVDLGDPDKDTASMESLRGPILADCAEKGIEIYCVGYSDKADYGLLDQIAQATGGLAVRGDRPEDLQRLFLRLFEQIAQPQTVPFQEDRAQIDSSVREATFVITRSDNQPIRLIMPDANALTKDKASNGNWFSSPHCDLVTIPNPMAGDWRVEPFNDTGDNKVMILADLELVCENFPGDSMAGEDVPISACLKSNGSIVRAPELLENLTMRAVLKSTDGEFFPLADDGMHNDGAAGDGVFGGFLLAPNTGGNFELEIIAKSPTFQRRIVRTLSVLKRWFSVQIEKDMVQAGEKIKLGILVDNAAPRPAGKLRFHANVVQPDGKHLELPAIQNQEDSSLYHLTVDETQQPGIYQITLTGTIESSRDKKHHAMIGPLETAVAKPSAARLALPRKLPPAMQNSAVKPSAISSLLENPILVFIECGILLALITISVQLTLLLLRRRSVPVEVQESSMSNLRRKAAQILREDEMIVQRPPSMFVSERSDPSPAATAQAVTATAAAAATMAVAENLDDIDAIIATTTREASVPPSREILVEAPTQEENTDAGAPEANSSASIPTPANDEIIEKLTEEEQNLLSEIMNETLPPQDKTPEEESPAIPAETLEEPIQPLQSAPSTGAQNLSQAEQDLLAEITAMTEDDSTPANIEDELLRRPEESKELNDGVPSIPDENDQRSDQDLIDDILNQIQKLTK